MNFLKLLLIFQLINVSLSAPAPTKDGASVPSTTRGDNAGGDASTARTVDAPGGVDPMDEGDDDSQDGDGGATGGTVTAASAASKHESDLDGGDDDEEPEQAGLDQKDQTPDGDGETAASLNEGEDAKTGLTKKGKIAVGVGAGLLTAAGIGAAALWGHKSSGGVPTVAQTGAPAAPVAAPAAPVAQAAPAAPVAQAAPPAPAPAAPPAPAPAAAPAVPVAPAADPNALTS